MASASVRVSRDAFTRYIQFNTSYLSQINTSRLSSNDLTFYLVFGYVTKNDVILLRLSRKRDSLRSRWLIQQLRSSRPQHSRPVHSIYRRVDARGGNFTPISRPDATQRHARRTDF